MSTEIPRTMKCVTRCVLLITFSFVISLAVVVITGLFVQDPKRPLPKKLTNQSGPVWFVQLSDLHLSGYEDDLTRASDLIEFCGFMKRNIRPSAVVISGDITSARDKDKPQITHQVREEWNDYERVLQNCRSSEYPWLDTRGNHDVFDVSSDQSDENLYKYHSSHGSQRSYLKEIDANGMKIGFLSLDFTPSPGFRAPLNFMGYLDNSNKLKIQELIQKSRNSDRKVFFGHYPTSFVETEDWRSVTDLMMDEEQNSNVYLCGHLHTLFKRVYHMYTKHSNGLTELELSDWKVERSFRVVVFDDDSESTLNFQDFVYQPGVSHQIFVVILKPSEKSDEVKALVFCDPQEISKVLLNEDVEMKLEGLNLYKAKRGMKESRIEISVVLKNGKIVRQSYSETELDDLIDILILRMPWGLVFQLSFFTLCFGIVSVLSLFRFAHFSRLKKKENPKIRISQKFFCCRFLLHFVIRKIWIISTLNVTFWPLILFPIYFMFLPWTLANILDDELGLIFSWGVWTFKPTLKFSPPNMNYFYGFFIIFWYLVPLIVILGFLADLQFKSVVGKSQVPKIQFWLNILLFVILLLAEIRHAFYNFKTYGIFCLFSPFSLGLPVISLFTYLKLLLCLKSKHFIDLQKIWACN